MGYARYVGGIIITWRTAEVLYGCAVATRRVGVKGPEELHSRTVITLTEAAANAGFVTFAEDTFQPASCGAGRVGKRKTRRKIRLLKVIPAGPIVCRPSWDKRQERNGV